MIVNFKNTIFILVVLLFLFQLIVMKQDSQINDINKKRTVALSTFSLYDITKHIVDDTAKVTMILPFGVDAHSYEPSPKQVAELHDSDLVIYSGAGLEPWCKNFEFTNKAIDMSRYIELIRFDANSVHEHKHKDSGADPHYWLSIENMIKATKVIKTELIRLIPINKELYEKNTLSYINMLKKLDKDYKKRLSECKLDTIIVNHNAYSYLSSSYSFNIEALNGLSPDAQTNAKNMINLIEDIKKHNVSTIFYESFSSDKAIKSIAKETNINVESLHPLSNITSDEAMKQLSYESIMRNNLEKISKALECI